jgi:hypothetical protein
MWNSTNNVVEDYLANESTIRSQSLVTAEWNLNIAENVDELGNYRYRPSSESGDNDYNYHAVPVLFEKETAKDPGSSFYFGATDADLVVDGGFDSNGDPVIFTSKKKKMKSLFSLEDCLGRFRPRSGINKVIYFDGKYLNRVHPDMARQPRFYFPTPDDKFKYWTSYRTEGNAIELESEITKVYATDVDNGIIKMKAPLNSFKAGDSVKITDTGITDLDGKRFVVHSSSSNYIKVYSDIVVTTQSVTGLGTATSLQNATRGFSYRFGDEFLIDDAAPFVTYSDVVPSNRLVVKMQTKVGEIDLGPYVDEDGNSYDDPFFDKVGNKVKAVPADWKIQILDANNNWVTAYDFGLEGNEYDIPSHGHVELAYGLKIPATTDHISNLRDIFLLAGKVGATSALPVKAPLGYAYIVESVSGPGTIYVAYEDVNGFAGYDHFDADYGWYVNTQEIPTNTTSFVTDFTSPDFFTSAGKTVYRDLTFIKGMRIVVRSMTIENAAFDLIEMSPRLAADITDMTTRISVTKHASDLGSSGLPVGQLLSSTGSLELFDYDQSFNKNNTDSIVAGLSTKNLQVKFYESLYPGNGIVYNIPIKTLYADGFPESNHESRSVDIKLKDLFFYFESTKAPELLIPNCSLSMAVSCLMDSIGFSNYMFKRPEGTTAEPVIPYFFVGPDTTIAQALEDLAVSTQTAMFLDEYNDLILMSKEYMMPKNENVRPTDMTLIGDNTSLANIMQLQSVDDDIFNDGKISYETKYIQRSYSSLAQANYLDAEKTWVYKPVLLWEVSPEENTKSWNDESNKQSSYTLAAIPLDSNLKPSKVFADSDMFFTLDLDAIPTEDLLTYKDGRKYAEYFYPYVRDGVVVNNTMDLGEAVYWLSRYNGYFYANGEIIKFDAVQYNVPVEEIPDIQGVIQKSGDNVTGKITVADKTLLAKISVGDQLIDDYGTFSHKCRVESVNVSAGYIMVKANKILLSNDVNVTFTAREASNNVWISDVEEYQKYFAKVPFGGKIYPTGLVRIYSEPFYDSTTDSGLKEGKVAKHGRAQFGTTAVAHKAGLDSYWRQADSKQTIYMNHSYMFNGGTIPATYQNVKSGILNINSTNAEIRAAAQNVYNKATVNGVIKNHLSAKEVKEEAANKKNVTVPGTIQSSALVLDGPSYPSGYNPQSFVQYVHKQLDGDYKHFSTRMRIIGSMENQKSQTQTPVGSTPYYTVDGRNIGGSSGGLGIWVDPKTNCGYYYEIVALTDVEANAYSSTAQAINTVFFYKIHADANGIAIPVVLWSGLTPIICDDGRFTGQSRMTTEKNPTVYDLSVEYSQPKDGGPVRFDLYMNDKPVGSVTDNDPLNKHNSVALFVRGSARAMFENLFAIKANEAKSKNTKLNAPVAGVFGFKNPSTTDANRKFALSGAIKQTVLDGITRGDEPEYNMYFEEFGTIMRECAYFNIKYDKAYPALSAKISPTFNNNQGYAISGFTANAFGAEFLVFNTTDTVLSLDSGSGNYLRIQGVTFTQNSRHDLTVDEFFSDSGDLSDPDYRKGKVYNEKYEEAYLDLKKNRLTNGKKSFSINAPYIQSQDAAKEMMSWLVGKIMKQRKAVGLEVFSMPHIQLGDIINIQYTKDGVGQVSGESSGRYVVYSIQYDRSNDGPSMEIHLSEVK